MLYEDLVQKITSCEKLNKALNCMTTFSSSSLNLVTPDWRNVLQESDLYKRHLARAVKYSKGRVSEKNVYVRNVIGMNNSYDVIVAGVWSLNFKNEGQIGNANAICSRMSDPLIEIGKSMAENDQMELQDNCRMFVENCSISVCEWCHRYKRQFDTGYNDWCIKSTKVFDGKDIKGMLKESVENAFGMNSFCGIMRLNIYSRYSFGENRYKIGGRCLDMILFKEYSLNDVNDWFGIIEPTKVPLRISFPEEGDEKKKSDESKGMEKVVVETYTE